GAYGAVIKGGTLSGEGNPSDAEAKIKMHIKTLSSAAQALIAAGGNITSFEPSDFYAKTADVLLPYLDSLHGSSIDATNYGIFTKLTQYWEAHFTEDLRILNCLPPDIVTRVTEVVPQIANFVKKIVDKGFAYVTSDGSVYFDIAAFE